MKPLRDLILIELTDLTTSTKSASGLVIVSSKDDLLNFAPEDDLMYDQMHKKKWQPKDLADRLVEESKKSKGLIKKTREGYNRLEDERVRDILLSKNKHSGIVRAVGHASKYYQEGDSVIYKGQTGTSLVIDGKEHLLVKESDVLAIKKEDKLIPHPDCVLMKITKESRDNLFKKQFTKEDGSTGMLFVGVDDESLKDRKATIFVSTGIIISAGTNVHNVQENDLGIVHYLTDNDDNIIVGYDGSDKLIIVDAVTSYHDDSMIMYENRKSKRDQAVHLKGDYDNLSSLLGVVRGGELYAIEPFVFLNHDSNIVAKVTRSGLMYYDKERILEREVLALSFNSERKFRFKKGDHILVHDYDIFEVLIDGKRLSCINDVDVLANPQLHSDIKAIIQKKTSL